MNNENFEITLNNHKKMYDENMEKLKKYQSDLNKAIENEEEKKIEVYSKIIAQLKEATRIQKVYIDYARPANESDLLERKEIRKNFLRIIDETIPDDVPFVFHGNNNIGSVFEIIKTGGLFPPNERGLDFISFASEIDVTWKKNISVTCEYADPASNFLPYGAIFVFLPLENEVEKVLNTGTSSEVSQGLSGVNFRQNPERLIAIITTQENKEIIQKFCLEYNLNPEKVFTHLEFIDVCQNLFYKENDKKI